MAKRKNTSGDLSGNPVKAELRADGLITLDGMYEKYFLDYASYVILERAVPAIEDGLKPVQRRILHTLFDMDDGRYHKVANVIGQTMAFHPHGDAAIGDAMVNLGQKDLMLDCQGNWGDARTGDGAAAARYIEVRLTKFALEVAFNPRTTVWQLSYDGRRREPVTLPVKFPLLLAQGVEGIAVGLSTKIMPHNFIELIEASIGLLKGKKPNLMPDFMTGGSVDVSQYNGGKRGGKVLCRAKVEKTDKNTLAITELPFGVTTGTMIDSILRAVEKGKIKVKKIMDNTAAKVEIQLELQPGVSPDVTLDALYAFTDCQVSYSPNACVIVDDKPIFSDVNELLRISTENTKELLRQELLIEQEDLEEKWHFASLEKIFIEHKIYRNIEESESFDAAKATVEASLLKYVANADEPVKAGDKRLKLHRNITDEDLERLLEIRIRRISKYNSFAADELIAKLEAELLEVRHHLANLTDFAIKYFAELLRKYGKGRERRTLIREFDQIAATEVVANNAKLYVNRAEGFVGMGLKKDEFVADCSDIDDIIVFRRDGKCVVSKVSEKSFLGKDILHVAVWKKNDDRTTYNLVYCDGKDGVTFAKRFQISGITRDKEYDLTKGTAGSRLLYFSANPNSEAELVAFTLSPACKARIKVFDYNFAEIEVKGRSAQGYTVTKYPVKKVVLKEAGKSTMGAVQIYIDEVSGKINTDNRGRSLGGFDTGDNLLLIYNDGHYELASLDMARRFPMETLLHIGKYDANLVVSVIHFDGNKDWALVKRFKVESSTANQKYLFISDHKKSKLLFASVEEDPIVRYQIIIKGQKTEHDVDLATFVDVKGWKAMGNKLTDQKLGTIKQHQTEKKPDIQAPMPGLFEPENDESDTDIAEDIAPTNTTDKVKPGDTIDFEIGKQGDLFG
jgi:topoisomerase IV subunit A